MKEETSIALIKKDIDYIKQAIDKMSAKLDKVVMEEDCEKRQHSFCNELKAVKHDVDDLKALKNKLIGWIAGVAVVGGGAGGLIVKGLSQVLAYYQ